MNADEFVGEKVHVLMRRRRISQEQLGQALSISQAAAGKKLLGYRGWTLDELIATAQFLGVELTHLLPGDDYVPTLEGRGRASVGAGYRSEGWGFESLRAHDCVETVVGRQVSLDGLSSFLRDGCPCNVLDYHERSECPWGCSCNYCEPSIAAAFWSIVSRQFVIDGESVFPIGVAS